MFHHKDAKDTKKNPYKSGLFEVFFVSFASFVVKK